MVIDRYEIEGHEIHESEINFTVISAHALVPKRWRRASFKLVRITDSPDIVDMRYNYNEKTTGLELHVPFGGFKRSSSETWREQGDAGLEFYTIEKTVYDNY